MRTCSARAVRLRFTCLIALAPLVALTPPPDAQAGSILNDVQEQNGFILAELAEGGFDDAADFNADEFNVTESAAVTAPQAPVRQFDLDASSDLAELPSAFFEPFHFAVMPAESDLLCEVFEVTGDRY